MLWSEPFDSLSVGERFRSGDRTVRDTDVIVFSALTGDWHPLHCDPEWAANGPFGERIAHGMLIVSLAIGLLPLDPERVIALRRVSDVVFKRPVRLNETVHVTGELTGLSPVDEHAGLVDFAWQIRNQDEALVVRAAVQLLWSRGGGPAEASEAELDRVVRLAEWQEPIAGGTRPGEFVPLPL